MAHPITIIARGTSASGKRCGMCMERAMTRAMGKVMRQQKFPNG